MNASQTNRVSHAEASAPARARLQQTVVLMSESERTATHGRVVRILVPINATDESRWGIQYALQRHREGSQVEVVLLNIGEPITDWQVLRFRTQKEISRFQSERAQAFIDEATKPLVDEHIDCRGCFKQGDIVFSILDTAEELGCDEIAMPAPRKGFPGLFSRNIVGAVMRRQRDVAVVAVDGEGVPVTERQI